MANAHSGRVFQFVILVSLGCLLACTSASSGTPGATVVTDGVTTTVGTQSSIPTADSPTTTPVGCQPPTDGVAWRDDGTVTLEQISAADGVDIYAAEYPLPGPTDGLWTQWGQGIALGDGRHLSAVGDHLGIDANSYLFVYDEQTRAVTRFGDVLSVFPHEPGAFGYGKIHAQMVRDACGSVWAATYWGTRDDLEYGNGYEGDRLLEIDPAPMTVSDRGAFAGEHGNPTMAMALDGRTIVAGSVDVESEDSDSGLLTVYDTSARETVTQVDDPRQEGFRALGIDPVSGNVFYSIGDNSLAAINPATGELSDLGVSLPGWWLRSVTRPSSDGTVYGAADDEPGLFSISPAGELTDLGDPGASVTSIAMTPDGSRIFWMPDAHGGAWEIGAPVRSMDTSTGEIVDVASLVEPFAENLGLLPGGSYSLVYDEGRLIIGVNASPLEDDSGFGNPVLVVIEGL